MVENMENDAFASVFVEMIREKGIAKYGDHSKFARAIFGEERSSVVKWRTIRNGNAKGQRDIRLDDLLKISAALGEALSSLFFQADERLKMLSNYTPQTVVLPVVNMQRERERESKLCSEARMSDDAEAVSRQPHFNT